LLNRYGISCVFQCDSMSAPRWQRAAILRMKKTLHFSNDYICLQWRFGNVVGHINKVTLRWARFLVLRWVTITSHSGQLSLLPSSGRKWALAKGQWQCCAAGKVTVGLASHRPCVTDSDRLKGLRNSVTFCSVLSKFIKIGWCLPKL